MYVKEDKGYMYVASNANTRYDPKIIKKQIGIIIMVKINCTDNG